MQPDKFDENGNIESLPNKDKLNCPKCGSVKIRKLAQTKVT